jgi:hypothetical protein
MIFKGNASIIEFQKLQKSTVVIRFKFFILRECVARNSQYAKTQKVRAMNTASLGTASQKISVKEPGLSLVPVTKQRPAANYRRTI